ncbi:hypothetical protein QJS10_CPA08g00062 [Acorus calamus]|uniref:Protein-lysine N-methyltransferase QJS10_CPA08g00062 n=1 Tax=Acorus calamus TaxID=4465 RepID=A0AAV9ED55_ACOCL|nr:hypothetical protein QJS10_CPA08g00062 [Acorus calamus]
MSATDEAIISAVESKINDSDNNNGDDDDPPLLSSRALEALKEFLNEQSLLSSGAEEEVKLVSEDWRLSQFWYDRETAETVAGEIRRLCSVSASSSSPVALVACPTLYPYIKKLDPNISVQLLEYDKRFEEYGSDFNFYDYNQPEDLPPAMKHDFQVVVADPPYLSKECLEKVAQTVAFLMRPQHSFSLLLTGEVQKERAAELLGLHPCGFRPQHTSKLGNEFRLFTNYDPKDRLGGWEHVELPPSSLNASLNMQSTRRTH